MQVMSVSILVSLNKLTSPGFILSPKNVTHDNMSLEGPSEGEVNGCM